MSLKAKLRSQCTSKREDGPCPVLHAHVNGCPVLVSIDSGSTESFATRNQIDFWNSHGSNIKIEENAEDFLGTVFNGTKACSRGRATIPISFGGQQRPWPCTIVDGECSSIILGMDFLRNFAARLNFETGCIVWLATPLSQRSHENVVARAELKNSANYDCLNNDDDDKSSSSWEDMDTEDSEAETPAKKFRDSAGESVASGSLVGRTGSAATRVTGSAATGVSDALRSLSTNRSARARCRNYSHEEGAQFEDVYDLKIFKELDRLYRVQAECDENERALWKAVAKCKTVLNYRAAPAPEASSRDGNARPTNNRGNSGLEEFRRLLLAVERSTRELSLGSTQLPNEGPFVD